MLVNFFNPDSIIVFSIVVVVGFKVDCLTGDLDLWVGCPQWEFFTVDNLLLQNLYWYAYFGKAFSSQTSSWQLHWLNNNDA